MVRIDSGTVKEVYSLFVLVTHGHVDVSYEDFQFSIFKDHPRRIHSIVSLITAATDPFLFSPHIITHSPVPYVIRAVDVVHR